jgi:hypothetical protein
MLGLVLGKPENIAIVDEAGGKTPEAGMRTEGDAEPDA